MFMKYLLYCIIIIKMSLFFYIQETCEKASEEHGKVNSEIENYKQKIIDGESRVKELENQIVHLQEIRDQVLRTSIYLFL